MLFSAGPLYMHSIEGSIGYDQGPYRVHPIGYRSQMDLLGLGTIGHRPSIVIESNPSWDPQAMVRASWGPSHTLKIQDGDRCYSPKALDAYRIDSIWGSMGHDQGPYRVHPIGKGSKMDFFRIGAIGHRPSIVIESNPSWDP